MRKTTAVLLFAVLSSGCGSLVEGKLRLGRDGTGPSFETVVDYIKLGDEPGARTWLAKLNVGDARADELIVRARVYVAKLRAECTGEAVCP